MNQRYLISNAIGFSYTLASLFVFAFANTPRQGSVGSAFRMERYKSKEHHLRTMDGARAAECLE